jgi:SAM-dependent methyltransferase
VSSPAAGSRAPTLPDRPPPVACDACTSDDNHRVFAAREMMFGLRDRFRYQECASCGHLQLLDVPRNLGRYYPPDYYSLDAKDATAHGKAGFVRRGRSELLLRLPPRICDRLAAWHVIDPAYSWLAGLGVSTRSRICDVGSGGGEFLLRMAERGFREIVGLDPHVERDIEVAPSVWVRKLAVEQLDGQFDAILLNHSFEHMADPATVLTGLRERLAPDGALVVRVPVAGGRAWRRYGADWVGLDPPRHIFVPTERSMRLLAHRAGLRVVRVFHDSHALQFWGSEQYRRDVPLHDPRSWSESPDNALFSRRDVARWHVQARRLNAAGDGDSAGFVLRRAEVHPRLPAA